MEGINPERLAMIANPRAPADRPVVTEPLNQKRRKTASHGITKTASNNIPLGAPRRGPRASTTAQDPSHAPAGISPSENVFGNVPAAPANPPSHTEMTADGGGVDDEMDDDSNDEDDVVFILEKPAAHAGKMAGPEGNQDSSINPYFQAPDPFAGFGTQDLWRPPADDPDFVLRTARVTDPIRLLHSHCRKIRHNWKCDPSQCLPPELRRTTPYSLVMLSKLASLSKLIPYSSHGVQELLFAQTADRVSRLPMPANDSANLRIVQSPGQKHAEEWILENEEGLMLGDVDYIFWQLKTRSPEGIPIVGNMTTAARSVVQASVALSRRKSARIATRKAIKEERDAAERQTFGRVLTKKKRKHQQQIAAAQRRAAAQAHAVAQNLDTKQLDLHRYPLRRRDDALVQQLAGLGVDGASPAEAHGKDIYMRREANLQRGLPLEPIQSASMPSQHSLAGERYECTAIQGMSSPGLRAQQPLPPFVPGQSADVANEDKGGVSLVEFRAVPTAQGNIQGMDIHGYPAGASQDAVDTSASSRCPSGTRCPQYFRFDRKCTHTESWIGASDQEGHKKARTRGVRKAIRGKGRGGDAEHVGPRHGEVIGADAAVMDTNNFGHRMMEEMGWSKGTALGKNGEGVLTPIEQRMRQGKAGLG